MEVSTLTYLTGSSLKQLPLSRLNIRMVDKFGERRVFVAGGEYPSCALL